MTSTLTAPFRKTYSWRFSHNFVATFRSTYRKNMSTLKKHISWKADLERLFVLIKDFPSSVDPLRSDVISHCWIIIRFLQFAKKANNASWFAKVPSSNGITSARQCQHEKERSSSQVGNLVIAKTFTEHPIIHSPLEDEGTYRPIKARCKWTYWIFLPFKWNVFVYLWISLH